VDYVDYGAKVAAAVSGGDFQRGILLCGTGIGMSITANRWPKVRATLCNEMLSAIFSRRHNDSNILVMGARIIGDVHAKEIVRAWFETPFDGGRHQARLEKIETVCRTAC
jgi:ribose 5-phosphate isomerase B